MVFFAILLRVKSNTSIELVDNGGLSVLHYACIGQHLGCVQLLLDQQASVLLRDMVSGPFLRYFFQWRI